MIRSFHKGLAAQLAKMNYKFARDLNTPGESVIGLLKRGIAFDRAAGNPGTFPAALRGLVVRSADYSGQVEQFAVEIGATTFSECQPAGILRLNVSGEIFGVPAGFDRVDRCEQVHVTIDSIGGDAGAVWRMIERLEGKHVETYISNLACSAAALLSQAGARRTIAPGGRMMIHPPVRVVLGGPEALMKAYQNLLDETDHIADFLVWRTGQPREVVLDWLSGPDVWFSAQAALAANLVDEIS